MGRKAKKQPVMSADWENLYEYYKANKSNENCFDVIFSKIESYINMCKKTFKVNPIYWKEYDPILRENIWRAFLSYRQGRNTKFSTWVYRLSYQSAWGFIKDKCKEIDKDYHTITCDQIFDLKDNNINANPNELLVNQESEEEINRQLDMSLRLLLKGPIEYDVCVRKYGLFGFRPMNIDAISEELNLTKKTVEQIITRNNNSIGLFKRYFKSLKDSTSKDKIEIIKQYKNTINNK